MLLIEGGHHSGLIGSDALHHELHEAARQADAKHHPRTLGFSTAGSPAQRVREGIGQTVEVLLEPLSGRTDAPPIAVLEHCLLRRRSVDQATVLATREGLPTDVGDRLAIDETGEVLVAPANPEVREALGRAMQGLPAAAPAIASRIEIAGEKADVLLERIEPPIGLLLFGGGLDACPLVKFAHELGWNVSVIDPDPARANKGRFPVADAVIVSRADQISERVPVDRRSAAVVMTHNPDQDRAILSGLHSTPVSYLGFAPREYDPRILFEGDDLASSPEQGRVFSPAGLEIGALTAHETAIAVVAQIIRHFSGATS
jgi:xanthine/CO dehydrogenase XdhC/CoxF family maturation factor